MRKASTDKYPFHYLYCVRHPSKFYYYGIHSSNDPYSDKYMGSGVKLREIYKTYPKKEWHKQIVQVFSKRVDAEFAESKMVTLKMLSDPLCLNKIVGGVRKR